MKLIGALVLSSAFFVSLNASANHVYVCVARDQHPAAGHKGHDGQGKGSTLKEAKADALRACQAVNGAATACALETCSM